MAGNVLDKAGYACLLPALIKNWRDAWSAVEGATDPCVWDDDGELAKCVGTRGKISELDASLQGAKSEFDAVDDEWWFPFTVLSRAVETPSSS